jgi:hypothetical protein
MFCGFLAFAARPKRERLPSKQAGCRHILPPALAKPFYFCSHVEMASEPMKWYDETAANSPWIKALAEVRHRATREGWCHQHVQAIIVAIDQYAERALGNRDFFLNKPQAIGGSMKGDIP